MEIPCAKKPEPQEHGIIGETKASVVYPEQKLPEGKGGERDEIYQQPSVSSVGFGLWGACK